MRKLASIQKIWKIEPIEGADRIELAHVCGWQCVVKKGEFKEMETAVYFEIDSFLPIRPEFEFLRGSSYKKSEILGEGFKLKTQRFRGEISQGLLLPISSFPELEGKKLIVGDDVTDLLHVKKWEIEERVTDSGTIIGERPSFIPKTDETRVQAEPDEIKEFFGKPYYITQKMDGSSHSVGIDEDGSLHVCGHNYEYADDGKSTFYEYVKKNEVERKMRAMMNELPEIKSLVLQGEWCGPGIQRNPVGLKVGHWFVFTVIVNGHRLGRSNIWKDDMFEFVHHMGLETVPIVEEGNTFPCQTPEELLALADGEYEKYDGLKESHQREGIVIRPFVPVQSKVTGTWLSMKAVSNAYLLKKKG